MSIFKSRHPETTDTLEVPAFEEFDFAWPDDTTDEIDDDAFAQAIAAGRLADPEHDVTVAA